MQWTVQPWPKLSQALRSSRETELAYEFPIHVVTAWLGNTPSIPRQHELLTSGNDFESAAINGGNESGDHVQTTSEKVW